MFINCNLLNHKHYRYSSAWNIYSWYIQNLWYISRFFMFDSYEKYNNSRRYYWCIFAMYRHNRSRFNKLMSVITDVSLRLLGKTKVLWFCWKTCMNLEHADNLIKFQCETHKEALCERTKTSKILWIQQ